MELYHHGVKGQKWGVRRFQNPDGTLTIAGKNRLSGKKTSDKVEVSSKTKRSSYTREPGFQTEEEYYEWVKAGMPKREPKTFTYEETSHTYKSKGSDKGRSEVDNLAKDEKYWEADRKFDLAGMKAIDAYSKGGKDEVTKLLKKELKGMEYELALYDTKVIDSGEQHVTFSMKAYGKDYIYSTSGEQDYSDDQYFTKRR